MKKASNNKPTVFPNVFTLLQAWGSGSLTERGGRCSRSGSYVVTATPNKVWNGSEGDICLLAKHDTLPVVFIRKHGTYSAGSPVSGVPNPALPGCRQRHNSALGLDIAPNFSPYELKWNLKRREANGKPQPFSHQFWFSREKPPFGYDLSKTLYEITLDSLQRPDITSLSLDQLRPLVEQSYFSELKKLLGLPNFVRDLAHPCWRDGADLTEECTPYRHQWEVAKTNLEYVGSSIPADLTDKLTTKFVKRHLLSK
jgi:hypothetical protein